MIFVVIKNFPPPLLVLLLDPESGINIPGSATLLFWVVNPAEDETFSEIAC